MTPAERLAIASHACHLLAQDWPLWASRNLPDGWPNKTPGSGLPGGGSGISDRTGEHAAERIMQTHDREGVDLPQQVASLSGHLLELALAMQHAAIGHAPAYQPHAYTPGVRLEMASWALTTTGQNLKAVEYVRWDGAKQGLSESLDLAYSYLARLRKILPPKVHDKTFEKDELCHGGVSRGHMEPWGRACTTPAVTRDGLCGACDKRRRRWEAANPEQAA